MLKNILEQLQNCVTNDEYGADIPLVWSKEFQRKLSLNTNHWNDVQRKASHVGDMDFQDEEDDYIGISYDDNQDELSAAEITFNPDFDNVTWSPDEDDYEEYEEESFSYKTKWGPAFLKYLNADDKNEEEEEDAVMHFNPSKTSEYDDDCPDCFGTGAEFPRLKGECKTCNGSGKVKEEEQEEGDNKQQAREVRDKAVAVRDKAVAVRDRAKISRDRKKNPDETDPTNQSIDDQYGADDPNDQEDFGDEQGEMGDEQEWDDPNYQGSIRKIDNAHLVYKRQQEDGTFDELWQYNLGDDFKKELQVRRAILAGTDIPINKMRSPDNNQTYELWTVGNGQLLHVKGLPN